MFTADQLMRAFVEVLKARSLRATTAHVRIEAQYGMLQFGLSLTDEFALVPSEEEWARLTDGMEPAPPRPAGAFVVWGLARPVSFTRDNVPRLECLMSAAREADGQLVGRGYGQGEKNLDGLRVAMREALRTLGLPIHQRTLWWDRPEES